MRRAELLKLFAAERASYSSEFPLLAGSVLETWASYYLPGGREWRDIAQAVYDGGVPTVRIVQRALRLPRRNLVALIRHELAHLANMSLSERQADALAMRVTGVPVRYDARDLQTTGRGGKRPGRLHR
jgi:hypothetical protein